MKKMIFLDFSKRIVCILIIKKHASIIKNVIDWVLSYDAKVDIGNSLDNIPLLLIDVNVIMLQFNIFHHKKMGILIQI